MNCRWCKHTIYWEAINCRWVHVETFDGRKVETACEPDMQSQLAEPEPESPVVSELRASYYAWMDSDRIVEEAKAAQEQTRRRYILAQRAFRDEYGSPALVAEIGSYK